MSSIVSCGWSPSSLTRAHLAQGLVECCHRFSLYSPPLKSPPPCSLNLCLVTSLLLQCSCQNLVQVDSSYALSQHILYKLLLQRPTSLATYLYLYVHSYEWPLKEIVLIFSCLSGLLQPFWVEIHQVLQVYDVSMLIILYVCQLLQYGCTLMFQRVGATHVGLRWC